MPKPPLDRTEKDPWPNYPFILKTSTSHKEGGKRHWSILTKRFTGINGKVKKLVCVKIIFEKDENGRSQMKEILGSEFEIKADLILLSIGFVHPEYKGMLDQFKVKYDIRGNVKTNEQFMTSVKGVFTAGDMHRGQSLIVWAIYEGRQAAYHIDKYLMGTSTLPNR